MVKERVLVTGGSGYIAAFVIARLLSDGWRVRTTVRQLSRADQVRAMIREAGADPGTLEFAAADLLSDLGWAEAVKNCVYVIHVASPFPEAVPKNPDDLIVPAREGALRVLRAARDAGVKRVVITSSFAAIGYGHEGKTEFTEDDWTNVAARVAPYPLSKTLAERAAWDFVAREGGTLELSAVNPTMVMGPVLGPDYSTSIQLVRRMLRGEAPGLPRLSLGIVDVRDVADLHVRAMTDTAARGQRFIAVSGRFYTLREVADTLKRRLGDLARKVPTRMVPDWVLKVLAPFDAAIGQVATELGKARNASSDKARQLLGWSPRPVEDSLADTAESLRARGLL